MATPTFVIAQASNNQLLFTLRAANNEVVLTSELYTSLAAVNKGIESVRTHAPTLSNYDKRVSVRGEPYFVLRAANHEVIGTSEMYSSAQARDGGIEAVRVAAESAEVRDARR